ncbi:hypothetical protein pEaSNUABM50_00479 [Erwinia phage pEa_SNUABM_50]|uniref:Uncharacterized protein n=3 Tax=Eneladusvirus BF TaxID=2560751 RepID=A0A7L8ZQG0_9CAUD|nr:hypothetical protein FDH34_gp458 [Serratia phage BF]QOI71483.1 hypothetical protein pEaSNUABM12_00577 [Erwinia phage pEa_SNUABM_12]QOI72482.1 hypothetical protein pEaSNUABM50_00479 [Erwinia phage pEa_SNUABM_50]QXO11609.1 hypothetical protein pEaSNUABM19_00485 [Erwinia phage pEa_SNUABM_19]QXO12157.1 hypothetical protein pEaSNUABM44_00483 [Erwinia phage pEa_SNUABM_44]AQW88987.1 hypothetical protein BF_0462 [Serratia phage BF]
MRVKHNLSIDDWKTIHNVLNEYYTSGEDALHYGNVYYEYWMHYCTFMGTSFNFTDEYIQFGETRSYIDKVLDEESHFQLSTVYNFYDLTFEDITALKEIYIFKRGEPTP